MNQSILERHKKLKTSVIPIGRGIETIHFEMLYCGMIAIFWHSAGRRTEAHTAEGSSINHGGNKGRYAMSPTPTTNNRLPIAFQRVLHLATHNYC